MIKRIVKPLMMLTVALLSLKSVAQTKSCLIINEIMQGNIDFILEANEFPDSWVELYNPTEDDINLNGYGIGLKKKEAYYFDFDTIVPSHGFIVLYCDKEAYNLHTDFRLDAGSGSIYLMLPDGTVADQLSHKKQLAPNIAYGRISDGSQQWGHELCPTPGQANRGGISSVLLPEPVFSITGGLYQDGFELKVSLPLSLSSNKDADLPSDTRLCITTDGREPTAQDAVEVDAEGGINFDIVSSIVIRAKLISEHAHSPRSTTHSYIFHPRQTDLAIVSIATNADFLYDDVIGIFARGLGEEPNYEMDLRRPVNIEYFDVDSEYACTVNQCGEIKVQGNWSTRFPQKSFNVYAQKRFGTKRFNAINFWPDKPNVQECKSFTMRNGGSDGESGRVRDQLSQTLLGRSVPGTDWQANREVVCYINGEYKGVYDLRERADDHNIAANYQGLEDIDLIDSWDEVKSGHIDFHEFVHQAGSLSTLDDLSEWTDIDQFINMYILEAFVCNTDFIRNNIIAWRPWSGDGRWHWILKDLDRSAVSWIDVDYDYFDFVRSFQKPESSQFKKDISNIFNLVLYTEDGRNFLADHMAVAMGDWLQYDYMTEVLDELCEQLEPEYYHTLEVYYPQTYLQRYEIWQQQINYIRQWWPIRTDYVYNKMLPLNCDIDMEDGTYVLKVNPYGRDLTLNGVRVYRPMYDGRYYNGRQMTLSTGDDYSGWHLEINYKDGSKEEKTVPSNICVLPSDKTYLGITAEICDITGIEDVIEDSWYNKEPSNNHPEYFNFQGFPVSSPFKGQLLIEKKGNSVRKIIF